MLPKSVLGELRACPKRWLRRWSVRTVELLDDETERDDGDASPDEARKVRSFVARSEYFSIIETPVNVDCDISSSWARSRLAFPWPAKSRFRVRC